MHTSKTLFGFKTSFLRHLFVFKLGFCVRFVSVALSVSDRNSSVRVRKGKSFRVYFSIYRIVIFLFLSNNCANHTHTTTPGERFFVQTKQEILSYLTTTLLLWMSMVSLRVIGFPFIESVNREAIFPSFLHRRHHYRYYYICNHHRLVQKFKFSQDSIFERQTGVLAT